MAQGMMEIPCDRDHSPSLGDWLSSETDRVRRAKYKTRKNTRRRARKAYAEFVMQRKDALALRSLSRRLAGNKADQRREYIEATFHKLANEWEEETSSTSSLSALAAHPKYRDIVDLGRDVVPFLLRDLRDRGRFWFPALYEITKVKPFDASDERRFSRMKEAWLTWGTKNKLI